RGPPRDLVQQHSSRTTPRSIMVFSRPTPRRTASPVKRIRSMSVWRRSPATSLSSRIAPPQRGSGRRVSERWFLVFLERFYAKQPPLLAEEGRLRHQKNAAKPPKRRRRARSRNSGQDRHPIDFAELTIN